MRKNESMILLFIIVIFSFIIIGEYFSIIMWILFFFLGKKISKSIFKSIPDKNYFSILYYIFSIIGLIICIDNYFNFNTLTGFALDDAKYLNGTKYLIGQELLINKYSEVSIFSYFLSIFAFPISIFKEVSLTDLIAVNWMVAALIGVMLDKLTYVLIQKNIPLILLILSYPLQFIMTDTLTRLYRDNIILLFLVICTLGIFTSKKIVTLVSLIPVGLLRIANISFLVILYIFNNIIKLKGKLVALIIVISISVVFISTLPYLTRVAMIYGSDITRQERYEYAFSQLDPDEALNVRFSKATSSGNELRQKAYTDNSISSIVIRAIFTYFYPLSLKSPNSYMLHGDKGMIKGFYIYYIVNWINTLSICITFPLLLVGIINCNTVKTRSLLSTYFLFLLFVLLVSGQSRHSAGAYIFNCVFLSIGYYKAKQNETYKIIAYIIFFLLLLSIVSYNL